jgi:hypothetical protein
MTTARPSTVSMISVCAGLPDVTDRIEQARDGCVHRLRSHVVHLGWQIVSALDETRGARRLLLGDRDDLVKAWSAHCRRLFVLDSCEVTEI